MIEGINQAGTSVCWRALLTEQELVRLNDKVKDDRMIKLTLATAHEQQAFCSLLVDYHHDHTKFRFDLVGHSPTTYGLGVKTVENFGEKARLQTTGCKCQQLR